MTVLTYDDCMMHMHTSTLLGIWEILTSILLYSAIHNLG